MEPGLEPPRAEEDPSSSAPDTEAEKDSVFGDLIRDLALGWHEDLPGSATFLVGAGCSVSAGIPLSPEIAREAALLLYKQYKRETITDADKALDWLKRESIIDGALNWSNAYYSLFEEVSRNRGIELQLIRDAIARAGERTNWSHICLGELVSKHFVHTVLTNNFDQLVLDGIVRTGLLPVVADGIEALDRISSRPDHPQVVHLHGSRHSYRVRNSIAAVAEPYSHVPTISTLYGLLHDSSILVVIGYSGGEEGIMRLLVEAVTHLPDKRVYWVAHASEMSALSAGFQRLNAVTKNVNVMLAQDSDIFFRNLTARLGIGAPEWMREPLRSFSKQLRQIANASEGIIADEVESRTQEAFYLDQQLTKYREEKAHLVMIRDKARLSVLAGDLKTALPLLQEIAHSESSYENWRRVADIAFQLKPYSRILCKSHYQQSKAR